MTDETKKILIGVAIGAAAVTIVRTDSFRKCCARIVAGGLQLKDDAAEYLETIKEEAEDVKAEKNAQAKA